MKITTTKIIKIKSTPTSGIDVYMDVNVTKKRIEKLKIGYIYILSNIENANYSLIKSSNKFEEVYTGFVKNSDINPISYQDLTNTNLEKDKIYWSVDPKVSKRRFNNYSNYHASTQDSLENMRKNFNDYDSKSKTHMRVPKLDAKDNYLDSNNQIITDPIKDKDKIDYELKTKTEYDQWKQQHLNFISSHSEYSSFKTLQDQDKDQMKSTYSQAFGLKSGSPEEIKFNSNIDSNSSASQMVSQSLMMNHSLDTSRSMFVNHENSAYYLTDINKEATLNHQIIELNNINNSYAKKGQTYDEVSKKASDFNIDFKNHKNKILNIDIIKYEKEDNTYNYHDKLLDKINKYHPIHPTSNDSIIFDVAQKALKLHIVSKKMDKKEFKFINNKYLTTISELEKDMSIVNWYDDNISTNDTYLMMLGHIYIYNLIIDKDVTSFYKTNFLEKKENWQTSAGFKNWLTWFEKELVTPSEYNNFNLSNKKITKIDTYIDCINDDKTKRKIRVWNFDLSQYTKQIVIDVNKTSKQYFKFDLSNQNDIVIFDIEYNPVNHKFVTKTTVNGVIETNTKQLSVISDIKLEREYDSSDLFNLNNKENIGWIFRTKFVDQNNTKLFDDIVNFNGFESLPKVSKLGYDIESITNSINSNEQVRVIKFNNNLKITNYELKQNFNGNITLLNSQTTDFKVLEVANNMFKIKSIECSVVNNTKIYILNVENNTTSYLVNPSDFDNQNQLRLLTNIELEDYVTSNKFSINEDIIIHRDQNSKVATPIVDYSNNFGYFVYEYDYKTKQITTYIDMPTLNTRYERDIVKNLILVGNDNNNWLIQKGNKTKALSSILHDKQMLFSLMLKITQKDTKQIEVIKQNLDIHYTTYDKTMFVRYNDYVIELIYEVSKSTLRITKTYYIGNDLVKKGNITGDLDVELMGIHIKWSDPKAKVIDYSGTNAEVTQSRIDHLKEIVKDSHLQPWVVDYFTYKLDNYKNKTKTPNSQVSDLEPTIQSLFNTYFSQANQSTRNYDLNKFISEVLKNAPIHSKQLDILQRLELMKWDFIEADMHRQIQSFQTRDINNIIIDKMYKLVHDTYMVSLESQKDNFYKKLDNLKDQNLEIDDLKRELENIKIEFSNTCNQDSYIVLGYDNRVKRAMITYSNSGGHADEELRPSKLDDKSESSSKPLTYGSEWKPSFTNPLNEAKDYFLGSMLTGGISKMSPTGFIAGFIQSSVIGGIQDNKARKIVGTIAAGATMISGMIGLAAGAALAPELATLSFIGWAAFGIWSMYQATH